MHLRNGATADCDKGRTLTLPSLANSPAIRDNYQKYLDQTCQPTPSAAHWGSDSDIIQVKSGDTVTRGQIIGKAGSTGPGGCGCKDGGPGPNTHLHIFFARKEAGKWYFFDPYGVYGPPNCYPTSSNAGGGAPGDACGRYPSGWLDGNPRFP
jgi:hypothetical protein